MATTTANANDVSTTDTNSGGATASLQKSAQPYLDKAKGFAKQRPWASAALAGVVGVALLNTLRGK